jgi:hypothetical protein
MLPLGLFSQVLPYDVAVHTPKTRVQNDPEEPPAVKQGVIKVRKPRIRPYFKCEYYLTLARVREVEVEVPVNNGILGNVERVTMPFFDSSISNSNIRLYPEKNMHFSRLLVDSIDFAYAFEDSASIDTMVVQMWIGTNGKIKWVDPDTMYNGDMPRELEREMFHYTRSFTEWGKGGGYQEPKRFMRKQKRMAGNYYCKMYIIASAKPLTAEQRHTGARWAPFDIPLNSPPGDPQQKDFIEGHKRPKNDSVRK